MRFILTILLIAAAAPALAEENAPLAPAIAQETLAPPGIMEPESEPVPDAKTATGVNGGTPVLSGHASADLKNQQALRIAAEQCTALIDHPAGKAMAPDMRFAISEVQALMTPEQQMQFNSLFTQRLVRQFDLVVPAETPCRVALVSSALIERTRTPQYVDNHPLATPRRTFYRVIVRATVLDRKGREVPIIYTLHRGASRYWRIQDMMIAGAAAGGKDRADYFRTLSQSGPEALLQYVAGQLL